MGERASREESERGYLDSGESFEIVTMRGGSIGRLVSAHRSEGVGKKSEVKNSLCFGHSIRSIRNDMISPTSDAGLIYLEPRDQRDIFFVITVREKESLGLFSERISK